MLIFSRLLRLECLCVSEVDPGFQCTEFALFSADGFIHVFKKYKSKRKNKESRDT